MLSLILAGCRGDAPAGEAPAPASGAAPASAPPSDRWQRAPGTEPHPEARALYRRAATLVQSGRLAEAEPLFAQLIARWPESRFARRLSTPGLPPSVLGQAAALGVGLWALVLYVNTPHR
ncbi:MAG: hypothetical protein R3F60_14370 [bacterium]